jgi:hypothetical protein
LELAVEWKSNLIKRYSTATLIFNIEERNTTTFDE